MVLSERSESKDTSTYFMYFVYLIGCNDGTIYTGITTDVQRRFNEHKSGRGGHYTKSKGARGLLYSEQCMDKSTALKREAQIKGWTRIKKLNLIRFGKPIVKSKSR